MVNLETVDVNTLHVLRQIYHARLPDFRPLIGARPHPSVP
jgi:hypothetical protein